MITVKIPTVDGGLMEFTESDSIVARLTSLRADGYEGKELIHALLTDDWGPPPRGVQLEGRLEDGTRVDEYIPYQ